MINFDNILIENYYGIGKVFYEFKYGIFKLEGHNGATKSSVISAVSQCLFNKSIKNPTGKIENTYNKFTGKPYRIELNFTKHSDKYNIVNDRNTNKIVINKNGEDLKIKGIKSQLLQIQNIIGCDFDTFNGLTVLTSTTLDNILAITHKDNILFKFLNLEKLKGLEKYLKVQKKEVTADKALKVASVSTMQRTISSLEQLTVVDTEPLKEQQAELQDYLAALNVEEHSDSVKVLIDKVALANEEVVKARISSDSIQTEVDIKEDLLQQVQSGTCPICGSDTSEVLAGFEDEIRTLQVDLSNLNDEKDLLQANYKALSDELYQSKAKISDKKQEVLSKINTINGKILVAEEQHKKLMTIKKDVVDINERIDSTLEDIKVIDRKLVFLESSLAVIKSGKVTKSYIDNFVHILNSKISKLVVLLDMNATIVATTVANTIHYTLTNLGELQEYNDFSSGERTRISLIVLLSVLESLEELTDTSFNLLVFDELLAVVDTSGLEVFKAYLNSYRKSKSVIAVLHHDEISDDFFDGTYSMVKENGISRMVK